MVDFFNTLIGVVTRARWWLTIGAVAVAAFSDAPASRIIQVFGIVLAVGCVLAALAVLGWDPVNPLSVVRSPFRRYRWGELALVVLGVGFAVVAVAFSNGLPDWASRFALTHGGDANLVTCAVVCALAAAVCVGIYCWHVLELRVASDDASGAPRVSAERVATLECSRTYWKQAAELLAMAFVALVPAAFLANWAFNVLTAVLLPLLVLSVRREQARHRAEAAAPEPDPVTL